MREKSLSSSPALQKASHRILSGGAELTVCCVSARVSPTQHVGLCAGAGAGKRGVRSRLFNASPASRDVALLTRHSLETDQKTFSFYMERNK